MPSSRILVFGAGAIGCTLAWHLAKAGMDVSLLARGEAALTIKRDGLRLWSSGEDCGPVQVRVVEADGLHEDFDFVLVCVKQYDLPGVLQTLVPAMQRGAVVVPVVNGIPWWFYRVNSRLESLRATGCACAAGCEDIPLASVVAAVTNIPASIQAPGVVHQGARNTLTLGELDGRVTDRMQLLMGVLNQSALRCDTTGRIQDVLWSKLLGSAVFNPMSVLATATIRELLEDPYLSRTCKSMMDEVLRIGRALDVDPGISADVRMAQAVSAGDAQTSTLQAALSGKKLELSAILGDVVELGQAVGVATPLLDAAWGILRRDPNCS